MLKKLSEQEFIHRLTSTKFTDAQRELVSILYYTATPLTRRQIATQMFKDGHTHRLAGVLASLSKRLVPGTSHNAYRAYLDTIGFDDDETLSLSLAFRRALDQSHSARQKILIR